MLRAGLGVGDAETPAVLQRGNGLARGLDLGGIDLGEEHAWLDAALGEDLAPGSMISECPKVSRLFSCRPACAAANTKQPVSMARARSSVCQCASPVLRVKAEGTVRKEAPASASAR